MPAQQRATTTQTPRRPIGAGGARGASRSGSVFVLTTHALFAPKVQRKVSNGIAGLVADGASLDQQKSRANSCLYGDAALRPTSAPHVAEDPSSTRPERHFPSGAAQTRIVSGGPFGRTNESLSRHLKYMDRGRIPEFESYDRVSNPTKIDRSSGCHLGWRPIAAVGLLKPSRSVSQYTCP